MEDFAGRMRVLANQTRAQATASGEQVAAEFFDGVGCGAHDWQWRKPPMTIGGTNPDGSAKAIPHGAALYFWDLGYRRAWALLLLATN